MKKVLLIAPVMSRSGYGEMGRFALRSMISNPDIDLYVHNINWGKTGWIWKDDSERKLIDSLLQKTALYRQNGGQFDASVQCTVPNEWQKLTPHDIGYTAGIETDRVAGEWLIKGNVMDKIITISEHSKEVYKNTSYDATDNNTGQLVKDYKCTTPIDSIGFPMKDLETAEMELNLRHDFNFLCVAQMGPRKNVAAVLNNFIDAFKDKEVGLVMKLNGANDSIMDYHNTKSMFNDVSQAAKKEGWKCSINLLHGNLTDEQMQGLYQHPKIKSFVSFTHGEGFGLPMYEAVCNELPVVATDWSGHLDFLTVKKDLNPEGKLKGGKTRGKITTRQKMFAAVEYELKQVQKAAVWNGVIRQESKWAFIDDEDAKAKMLDVYENYDSWLDKTRELKGTYKNSEHYYKLFNEALELNTTEDDSEVVVL